MTGFGEAEIESCGILFTVQIKTVNNKYLKAACKLPEVISFLEESAERVLRGKLGRGSVSMSVTARSVKQAPLVQVSGEMLRFYIEQLSSASHGLASIDASALLSMPGVIEPYKINQASRDKIAADIETAIGAACEAVIEMRRAEGRLLKEDLLDNCTKIEEILAIIAERVPVVVQQYREKLRTRIDELIKAAKITVDEAILIRETAVFADRSDISEEIQRLRSHIVQFRAICAEGVNVGKRLDFLTQEMFREANTIGSKASDAEICQRVVDVKSCIDRIKEQVQNAE
jgi:uncharacterized protein (TIGR00255 family)